MTTNSFPGKFLLLVLISVLICWASGSKYLPEEEWVSPVYPVKN